jgi:enoyl-CoA hydratase
LPGSVKCVSDVATEPVVIVSTEGVLGTITLNRPRALNALSGEMILLIAAALERWRDDDAVHRVLIQGAGERGLCAGGDVRALYDQIVAGRPELTAQFFRAEYALNAAIAEYPKPVIAFADGITMGGGIGLAGHAAMRVVTERSRLAMPETRIGFTPDVGGTWLLGKAPGRAGEYLGLTGESMTAADALYAGFADVQVSSESLAELRDALTHPGDHERLIAPYVVAAEPSALAGAQAWVDEVFGVASLAEIIAALRGRTEPEAAAALVTLEEVSPTGLTVTLDAVREARAMSGLREALEGEYRRVMWFVHEHPDLVEGIRAQLVDKDRNPKWQPEAIAELVPDAGAPAREYRPAGTLFV